MKYALFIILFTGALAKHTLGQNTESVIAETNRLLGSNRKTVSDVLTDTALFYLHANTAFREVIRKHAKAEKITIASANEPGTRIVVNGTVLNNANKPMAGILIYFYHTSDKGWYSDTGVHIKGYEGDHRHSRLFGYVQTDAQGIFTINTIRPNGYPQSGFAGHIHLQMWNANGAHIPGIPGELQFEDDVRMTAERKQRSLAEGYLVAKNEGTKEQPVYNYIIKVKGD